jgi:hypothetical protein
MHKRPIDIERVPAGLHPLDEDERATEDTEVVVRPIDYLFAKTDHVPTPPPDAAERVIRYERGSIVFAIDGPVGTLRQMVIDEDVAEVKALIVRMSTTNESVLTPPELVDKCVGRTILLNVTREQFAKGASRSPRFDPRMFTRADTRTVRTLIPVAFRGEKQRSIVSIAGDALVTSEVLEPSVTPLDQPTSRPWWKRFGRSR